MKQKYTLLLAGAILLASCGAASYSLDLSVAAPAGAPAVAFYKHLSSDKLEINADPANVVAYFTETSGKDIIVAPTNAGLTAISKKKAPYKIAATLTFGNFYLAATGKDDDGVLDADDYVVAFQQNNVPDKIFNAVYGDMGLSNLHYVTAASDAAKCLITGKNESNDNAEVAYVLMAEPALANALSKNASASEYANLQTEFSKKYGGKEITQASIFVANSADKSKVNALLSSLKSDIDSFLSSPSAIDESLKGMDANLIQSKFNASAEALKSLTEKGNRMGLGYKSAYENRDAVENFVSLFGITGLDEKVYYK